MSEDITKLAVEPDETSHGTHGMDRRGFLHCMAWAGTGVVWTAAGGVLSSARLGEAAQTPGAGSFSFVQISDTHIGFKGEANKDALGTFEQAIARIKAIDPAPAFPAHASRHSAAASRFFAAHCRYCSEKSASATGMPALM